MAYLNPYSPSLWIFLLSKAFGSGVILWLSKKRLRLSFKGALIEQPCLYIVKDPFLIPVVFQNSMYLLLIVKFTYVLQISLKQTKKRTKKLSEDNTVYILRLSFFHTPMLFLCLSFLQACLFYRLRVILYILFVSTWQPDPSPLSSVLWQLDS